jgi:K(+)-stimulated pyrophosphate-energized sodium pump
LSPSRGFFAHEVLAAGGAPKVWATRLPYRKAAPFSPASSGRSVFAAGVFFLCSCCRPTHGERISRSIFFLVGALFSATTGMSAWLAVRANVGRLHRRVKIRPATRLAFRTSEVPGMFTVGLGLFGAA